jgi:hypothetical protein
MSFLNGVADLIELSRLDRFCRALPRAPAAQLHTARRRTAHQIHERAIERTPQAVTKEAKLKVLSRVLKDLDAGQHPKSR